MMDATKGASAPRKRSLFKRAAWQDAAKKENEDIFSHSNEFKDLIAEENRRKEEERKQQAEAKRKAEEQQRSEQPEELDKKGKRRKVSTDYEDPILLRDDSVDSERLSRSQSDARSRTLLSPTAPTIPSGSRAARHDTSARSTRSQGLKAKPVVVDLGDSDDDNDSGYKSKSFGDVWDVEAYGVGRNHNVALRPSNSTTADDLEEVEDPEIAAIEARARARAEAKRAAAASGSKAPVAQLLIDSVLPDTSPLMVKVRVDTTIDKPREAWCARQKFSTEMTRNVFFTWKGTRLYDSTRIQRLGVKIDDHGNVSLEDDDSLYDGIDTPKIHVEAWTDAAFAQYKREQAAEAEAKRKAAEPSPVVEEREPSLEPVAEAKKYRLFLKAKGLEDWKIQVRPETTFEQLADAFRTARNIARSQPLTLMFDGDRLSPLDIVQDTELEDMDAIDVLLK
ncbi:hypothetical protein SVAN01_07361 [Stagonosporopsis vannaccii]|nr:hypothetical protein SVAN01_07361 [Stagonosporopsis vannaccii]